MHAFDLNEILDGIAVFLSASSFRNCILVCHQWHAVFRPHLWTSVRIPHNTTRNPITLLNLTLNAAHVQELSLIEFYETADYLGLSFPRLQSLYLSFTQTTKNCSPVAEGLGFCIVLPLEDLTDEAREILCQLDTFAMDSHGYSHGVDYGSAIAQHLRDGDGMWENLEELELSLSSLEDRDMASIMGALRSPLKKLFVTLTLFGDMSARELLNATGPRGDRIHCDRLEALSLCGCMNVSGAMVQRFLCECPNLKDIRARVLPDLDVQKDPRPWVCKDLRIFQVGLTEAVTEQRSSEPSLFIDRLSVLDRLEILGLVDTGLVVPSVNGVFMEHAAETQELMFLKVDLRKGLDRLWRLKRLRIFMMDFSDTDVFSALEAQWMARHWTRLERVMLSKVQPLEQKLDSGCLV
ncbi:hypothetical protein EMPS_03773 [Entomortierella parvispora]|uniref:F-box domain-containing protein n=1 Tax=Entomortierella parvispora TaxID=205924 RepID=A0A9P3LUU7_9FUNG|nr:hypothetical protein EMPS_03773 [Entomortierella parvispora]